MSSRGGSRFELSLRERFRGGIYDLLFGMAGYYLTEAEDLLPSVGKTISLMIASRLSRSRGECKLLTRSCAD